VAIADQVSVSFLKTNFLAGVDLTFDDGTAYPDSLYQQSIDAAISWLEADLEVVFDDATFTERYDARDIDRNAFWLIHVNKRPIKSVTSLKARYGSFDGVTFPVDWIHISSEIGGQLQVIPGPSSMGSFAFTSGVPLLIGDVFMPVEYMPLWWEITYTAGFTSLPKDLIHAIALKAALLPLDVAGDLIAGAGIANKSISVDGLSQTIGTTASATNAGYGSRILQYERELKALLPQLRKRYRGKNMMVI
jgi:hypothetical protein